MTAAPSLSAAWSGPLTPDTAPAIAARLHDLLAGRLFAVAQMHSGCSPLLGLSSHIARLDPALEAQGTAVRIDQVLSGALWLTITTTDRVYPVRATSTTWLSFDEAGVTIRNGLLVGTLFWRFAPALEAL